MDFNLSDAHLAWKSKASSLGRDLPAAATSTDVIAAAARLGLIDPNDCDTLRQGYALMRDLFQWQRLSIAGSFDPDAAGPGLKRRMASVVGLPDFKVLVRDLTDTRKRVRAVYERFMAGP